ncbi:MAG: Rrf2 family transcriptional regulator [Calditrichia bacterium]
MKITAQEEYGLRILLRIARGSECDGMTIPDISAAEGLSQANVAKLCRILRMAGFISSSRGKTGGYTLSRPADEIQLSEVLHSLGGKLYDPEFCGSHAGINNMCQNAGSCAIQPLWHLLQKSIDKILGDLTLTDLLEMSESIYRHHETQVEN